jgi:hypothetical protein
MEKHIVSMQMAFPKRLGAAYAISDRAIRATVEAGVDFVEPATGFSKQPLS